MVMAPLRWKLLPTLLLALILSQLPRERVQARGAGQDGSQTPVLAAEPEDVSLSDLRTDPDLLLGRQVRSIVQLEGRLESWNPGLTRFGEGDWAGFSAWADEDFTWDPRVFADPMRRLFVRRDSALEVLVAEARRYERFEVVGTVREVLFEQPWIEVVRLKPLFELVGEGTILHFGRASEFARQGKYGLALQNFERARAAPLPANARAELEARIAECTRLRGATGGATAAETAAPVED